MIVETILNALKALITTIFGILPNIPKLESMTGTIDYVLDFLFSNLQLLGVFINIDTIKIVVPILIVIWNFERIYELTLWILKKIPMIGVE